MSTSTQLAKRLVLVANAAYDATNFDRTAGSGIGFVNANSALIANAASISEERIKLVLGAGSASPLVSETLTPGTIKAKGKAFAAPYEAASVIRFGAGTYSAGQELVVSVRFEGFGSLSMRNVYNKYGAYFVPANGTTSATAVAALASNLTANLAKDGVERCTVAVGGTTTFAATSLNTIWAAGTMAVVGGSYNITLSGAGNSVESGWVLIAGELYYLSVVAGTGATLNRPYAGATNAALDISDNVVEFTTADIILVAERQAKIDFEHPFDQIKFNTEMLADGEADLNATIIDHGSSIGSGFGPHVANLEMFANSSINREQFVDARIQYKSPMNTVVTTEYDCVNVTIGTTKVGFGSNVTSLREIEIYIPTGGGYASLVTHLNAFK